MTGSSDNERSSRTRRFGPPPAGFSTDIRPEVRGFEPPPPGLDLRTATAEELARHGIPRRPDPESEPYLAARWGAVFGRPLTIVGAELGTRPRAPSARAAAAPPDYNVSGWAGVIREESIYPHPIGVNQGQGGPAEVDPYMSPATFVSAQWTLPQLMGDPRNGDEFISAWVGLDGFNKLDEDWNVTGRGQVIRGGFSAYATGRSFEWVAWAQWYSVEYGSVQSTVTNFPAQSGDEVGVVACVGPPNSATVFLANLSRNHGTAAPLGQPAPGVLSRGGTAEWIVEGLDPSISLPFSPITFEECVAGSTQEIFHLTPNGIIVNMFEVVPDYEVGPNVTQTSITSPTTAVVEWTGTPGG